MNFKNTYQILLTLGLITLQTTTSFAATFPIEQNFSESQPDEWELRSSASWDTTVSGDETVRLTSAIEGDSGLAFYNDSFASSLGIVTQIRYYIDEGTGADGLSFFLVDGDQVDENNIAAGSPGGGLGYARSGTEVPGIPYAYLGVGFDEYGSFAVLNASGQTLSPQSVVLRGTGNGVSGYDYLTQRNVATDFGQNIDGGWRLARITVLPGDGSSVVRIEMSWDDGATWLTIIDDYEYGQVMPTNLKLGFAASTGGSTNVHAISDLSVTVPADLETTMITSPDGVYERGDEVSYSYQVINNGPNSAGTSTLTNTLPTGDSGFSDLTWTAVTSNGVTTSGDDSDVSSIPVNLPSGVSVTVTVTAKIGKSVVNTDELGISLAAEPSEGVSDPSPSTAQLTVDLSLDVPTPELGAALGVIEIFAEINGGGTPPGVDDYVSASTTGVTAENLSAVNDAVAEYGSGAALTPQALQAIIDAVIYDLAHPTITPSTSSRKKGTSVQSQVQNLISQGNTERAQELMNEYPNIFQSTTTLETSHNTPSEETQSVKQINISVRDLELTLTGPDVKALQQLLNAQGYLLAETGVGSIGNETEYFGTLTQNALARYQAANGIVPSVGYFGSITRAQMKSAGLAGLWW